jgi:hypothetical protein
MPKKLKEKPIQLPAYHQTYLDTGHFCVTNSQLKIAIYAAIIPALLNAENTISCTTHWRLQLSLLQAFPQFPVR